MDAMSEAIEGADVMLYGVSLAYKESANVRAELLHCKACFSLRVGALHCCFGCLTRCARCALRQCRLEANYAHQQELDMIPLMMQKDYRAQGWRKSHHQLLRLILQHRLHDFDLGLFCW